MTIKYYALTIICLSFLNACGNNGTVSTADQGSYNAASTSADSTTSGASDSTTNSPASNLTGTVTLTWDAPATRSDGSLLNYTSDLQSYKVYYGTSSTAYTGSLSVDNAGTTTISYTVSLPQGTYYFAVTAVDQSGQESGFSPEVSRAI